MKRKTNKTKEEAWSQTAHAPDGEQPGPEASDTSGQSVPKSKFRKKSQQEQAAAAKLHIKFFALIDSLTVTCSSFDWKSTKCSYQLCKKFIMKKFSFSHIEYLTLLS